MKEMTRTLNNCGACLPTSKENINANDTTETSKTELNLFFEYSLDIMVLIGFDNRIKQINPSFERILGWKKEEVISKFFQDFLHPDDIERSSAEANAHQTGKEAIRFENRYRCKDGSYRWISWNSHPLPEKQIVVGIGRDITERKNAEDALKQSEKRYRELFSSMTEMFQVIELV
jgi:PAS domain S-box-containing protein